MRNHAGVRILLALCLLAGCSDRTETEARGNVTLLLHQEGAEARAAGERLAKMGRRAIPTIEAALHTADPGGRKSLIVVLRQIGDGEAIPLLRHLAAFDADASVRQEAEWTLKQWAADASNGARAEKSKAALRAIDEIRAREEAG